jgi:predicted dehydrogenase
MTASARLRVAVIGTGYWRHHHLRALAGLPDVTVVPVDARRDGRTRHSDAPGLADELPHVDAVVVATPPATRATLVLAALAAGKHVLVEQPLATTTSDAVALVEAAEAAGRMLMVGGAVGHDPGVTATAELVRRGDVGPVHLLAGVRVALGLHPADVDVLTDLAPREVSIADAVLGSRPTSVAAWAAPPARPPHADVAHLRLHYEDVGATATLRVSRAHPRTVRRTVALGSAGTAVLDEHGLRLLASGDEQGELQAVPAGHPLAAQAREFVACALGGARPAADGRRGAELVRVLEAARRSLREGGRLVAVDEVGPVPPPAPTSALRVEASEAAR